MTIYAIDGPRASGKTTFVRLLSEKTGLPTFKDQRGDNPDQQMRDIFRQFAKQDVILDRCFLTEFVYSLHFNRRPAKELYASTIKLEQEFRKLGGVGLILLPNSRTLDRRVIQRNDGRGADIPGAIAYDLWWNAWAMFNTSFDIWHLDNRYPTIEEATERGFLKGLLNGRK